MNLVNDAWAVPERRRWMRPNAHLHVRPDAWRFMPAGAPKYYGKDVVRYFGSEAKRAEPSEHENVVPADAVRAERRFLLDLRGDLLAIKADIKFRHFIRALKANFSPSQPRVPSGDPNGGRWTSGAISAQSILDLADKIAGSRSYQECLDDCYPLLERVKPPGSDRNQWDFIKCMNACLQRR